MKKLLLTLLIVGLCVPCWAYRVDNTIIEDSGGDQLAVTSTGGLTTTLSDGTTDVGVTTGGELEVFKTPPSDGAFEKVSATSVSSYINFNSENTRSLVIYNSDPTEEVFMSVTGTVATLGDWEIPGGYTLSIDVSTNSVAFICSATEDANVYVYATYQ